jgi:hypothetical protein
MKMASRTGSLKVVRVEDRRTIKDWLALPYAVFADDPAWVPPLNFHERRRISPKHAPFFTFGEVALFIAYRGEVPVGRVSAQVNRRHLEYHRDGTGHFGFFDCLNDPEAADALVSTAANWLRRRGLLRMVGPLNFSLHDEGGCLVYGFELPPAFLMPHARVWTGALLEHAHLVKEIDLFAYRVVPSRLPRRIHEIAELAARTRCISTRPFDMRHHDDEIVTLIEIFNDAWRDNWGFVPFSHAEIDALLGGLRYLFLRGEYSRFVLLGDEPVGFTVPLQNINEVIGSFNGRLLPFNWLHLLWFIKRERHRSARVPLLGLKRSYQSTPMGGLILALLVRELVTQGHAYKQDWVEFSWVLETNTAMIKLVELAGGPPVKIYRIYSRDLTS